MLLNQEYNQKFDIWGLGIVLYELLSKTSPFNGIIIEHTIHDILNSPTIIKGNFSEPLKHLLSSLLSKNPSDRPSTVEILRHDWILQNLPKYDLSFLQHPAFRNNHQINDLLKYSKYIDLTPKTLASVDVRQKTLFGKVNSKKHEIFLSKNQEEASLKFPNIFHDNHFDHSYTQRSLNRSVNRSFEKEPPKENHSPFKQKYSPFKQNKIFDPMREQFQSTKIEDDEYDIIQHVPKRNSFGNQEEQRFSLPVEVEKRKKHENVKMSVFAENPQKLSRSSDFHERKTPQHSAGLVDNRNIRESKFDTRKMNIFSEMKLQENYANNNRSGNNFNERKMPESSAGLKNNYRVVTTNYNNQFDQGNNDSRFDNKNNNSRFENKSNNNSRMMSNNLIIKHIKLIYIDYIFESIIHS